MKKLFPLALLPFSLAHADFSGTWDGSITAKTVNYGNLNEVRKDEGFVIFTETEKDFVLEGCGFGIGELSVLTCSTIAFQKLGDGLWYNDELAGSIAEDRFEMMIPDNGWVLSWEGSRTRNSMHFVLKQSHPERSLEIAGKLKQFTP